jgi:N6-adenosine-specific RNA methylase IME4
MKYGAILADPPWRFETWGSQKNATTDVERHYSTMPISEIAALDVARESAAVDCVLFMWITWPTMHLALPVIESWGFKYKTCAFCWVKGSTLPMFPEDFRPRMMGGYWTRSNSEICLLATRGKPRRINADVHQVILAPLRQHSRKPDEIYSRIERLVSGPYLEMFARKQRPGWDAWGDQVGKFN